MEQEPLMLSGLQHFAFCRRQWALIHIEQQWFENVHTVEGNIFHTRTHDEKQIERRGAVLTIRGLRVQSVRMNVTGICDVVEFHEEAHGISIHGYDEHWRVYPVEYKKGAPKKQNVDELQLCAQAMCLEEMLQCEIPEGSLYYGETRHREKVEFTAELRAEVQSSFREMHELFSNGYTPQVKKHKGCSACSLKNVCLPSATESRNVHRYLLSHLSDQETPQ